MGKIVVWDKQRRFLAARKRQKRKGFIIQISGIAQDTAYQENATYEWPLLSPPSSLGMIADDTTGW